MTDKKVVLEILLKPGSKKEWIRKNDTGGFDIVISARPVDGKANAYLIKLLSKKLKVPQKNIEITRGAHSKKKTVSILGIDEVDFG